MSRTLLTNPWFVAPVIVILLLLLVALARVLNIGHDAGGHRGEPGAKPDKTRPPKAAPGEDAIAETIAGAKAAGFLGAPTAIIPIAPVSGTPPWALPGDRQDTATVHVLWPGLERGEELVPLPRELGGGVEVAAWGPDTVTRGLVVEPGWGEPDDAGWAEATVLSLDDMLGGYAYPHGFGACRHDTSGPAPESRAVNLIERYEQLESFRRELETAAGLDADGVFDLMGGGR